MKNLLTALVDLDGEIDVEWQPTRERINERVDIGRANWGRVHGKEKERSERELRRLMNTTETWRKSKHRKLPNNRR